VADSNILSLGAKVVVIPEQVSVDLTDEAVVLSLKDGVYYGLNDVGARIWELIQTPRIVSSICSVLEEEYEVDSQQCQEEVLALLTQLQEWELLKVGTNSDSSSDDAPAP